MDDSIRESAKCFVPEMLVNFIDRNVEKGKESLEPASFYLNGVCLLVDISGFTKLSGDFCGLGKGGIDELQLATNGYMGKLVEIIYTFGGEIIKFAGDAIICVFCSEFITTVSTKEKGSKLLRRSLSNLSHILLGQHNPALQMSNPTSPYMSPLVSSRGNRPPPIITSPTRLTSYITPDVILRAMNCAEQLRILKTEKLSVHVAMSCGEMCFGILGGMENRWECLISGPCIHQLSECLDDAPSMTAVISSDCAEILMGSCCECVEEEGNEGDHGESMEVSHVPTTTAATATATTTNNNNNNNHTNTTTSIDNNNNNNTNINIDTTTDNNNTTTNTTNNTTNNNILKYTILTETKRYIFQLLPLPSGNKRIISIHCIELTHSPGPRARKNSIFNPNNTTNSTTALKLIKQFVPIPIADEIEVGRGLNFIAEIREVTTMFMKVSISSSVGFY